MHRHPIGRIKKIGMVAALVALAIPVSLIAAAPASAVHSCTSSMSPKVPVGQSGLSVACLFDTNNTATTADDISRIEIADTPNAGWTSTAARTAKTSANAVLGATTLAFTPALTTADIGRPISGTGIAAGTFIKTIAGAISRPTSAAVPINTTITINHTRGRELNDADCTAASTTLTAPSGVFLSSDVGLSVTGGPYRTLARIVALLSPTTVTVDDNPSVAGNQAPSNNCSDSNPGVLGTQDVIAVGLVRYSPATSNTTVATNARTRQIALGTLAAGGGATCAGSTLTLNANGGGTFATDVGLAVFFKKATGAAADAVVRKVNSVTATTIVMSAACPAPAAAATDAVIGVAGSFAPADGAPMAEFTASLNLNPSIVPFLDDCAKNTVTGFGIEGVWRNPGSYARTLVFGSPTPVSTAQILFPTSIVAFAGYITYKTGGMQVGEHNEFVLSQLPTSGTGCPFSASLPKVALALRFDPVAGEKSVRAIGPVAGTYTPKVRVLNSTGGVLAPNPINGTACVIGAATDAPSYSCGSG
jgi:hypothetical protein